MAERARECGGARLRPVRVTGVDLLGAWARRLEEGAGPELGAASWIVSRVFERALVRPLERPAAGPRVIAIGGATLGGSCKTPLALVCAEELAQVARVAVVGHGYRGGGGPGDDARFLERRARGRFEVHAGPTRAEAFQRASARADVVILDGPLQIAPRHADLSLLALDAASPFSTGRVFPGGDLRATPARLLAVADLAVPVTVTLRAADVADLGGARVGVVTAIARPDRFASACRALGVRVVRHLRFRDHGPIDPERLERSTREDRLDVWITTEKCALHVPAARTAGVPIRAISADFSVSHTVRDRLHALASGIGESGPA